MLNMRKIMLCIEGIIILISTCIILFIVLYQFNIDSNHINNYFNYNCNFNNCNNNNNINNLLHKSHQDDTLSDIIGCDFKQYVQVFYWSNKYDANNLPPLLKYIAYRPLKWRPTFEKRKLFTKEMKELGKNISSKIKSFIDNKIKSNNNLVNITQIINKFNHFKQILTNNINNFIIKSLKKRFRRINMKKNIIDLIKTVPELYKDTKILQADKNYGNVVTDLFDFQELNQKELDNGNNFIQIIGNSVENIITNAKNEMKNILFKYKNIINDWSKGIRYICAGFYDSIGKWGGMPKVHKPTRKIRAIIRLRGSIIEIPGQIAMEILRKLIYGLKHLYPKAGAISCGDIRNIVINIDKKNKLNKTIYNKDDQVVSADINTMYDTIWGKHVHKSINISCNKLLPPNYITKEEVELLHRSINCVYYYAYFSYEFYDKDYNKHELLMKVIHSQIQGSKSGDPACDLTLMVDEINKYHIITKYFKLFIRYKDDKIFILNDRYIYNENNISNLLSTIYSNEDLKWDIDLNYITKSATCCDITLEIDYTNNKINYFSTNDKIRSYICKSSNVKQSINGITKTLQERYIICNNCEEDYINTKKLMFKTLIECNEWTQYDLRHIKHLHYNQKEQLLDKYLVKSNKKLMKYVTNNNGIWLFDKLWWNKPIIKSINSYMTYQKSIINEKELNRIIYQAYDILPSYVTDDLELNIYYKYQKNIKSLIK